MRLTVYSRINKIRGNPESETRFKIAIALTKTGRQVREELKAELKKQIDRPKQFTLNAFSVTMATKATLESTVFAKRIQDSYLSTLIQGGTRELKPFEKKTGAAEFAVPSNSAQLDQYGNVPRSVILKGLAGTGGYFIKSSHGQPIGIFRHMGRNLKPVMMFRSKSHYTAQLDLIDPVVAKIPAIFKSMWAAEMAKGT